MEAKFLRGNRNIKLPFQRSESTTLLLQGHQTKVQQSLSARAA